MAATKTIWSIDLLRSVTLFAMPPHILLLDRYLQGQAKSALKLLGLIPIQSNIN